MCVCVCACVCVYLYIYIYIYIYMHFFRLYDNQHELSIANALYGFILIIMSHCSTDFLGPLMQSISIIYGSVGWDSRIHRLLLCRRVRPLPQQDSWI